MASQRTRLLGMLFGRGTEMFLYRSRMPGCHDIGGNSSGNDGIDTNHTILANTCSWKNLAVWGNPDIVGNHDSFCFYVRIWIMTVDVGAVKVGVHNPRLADDAVITNLDSLLAGKASAIEINIMPDLDDRLTGIRPWSDCHPNRYIVTNSDITRPAYRHPSLYA